MINNDDHNGEYKDVDTTRKKLSRIECTVKSEFKVSLKKAALEEDKPFSKYIAALLYEASSARELRKQSKIKIIKSNKKPLNDLELKQLEKDLIEIVKFIRINRNDSPVFAQTIKDFKEFLMKTEFEEDNKKKKNENDPQNFFNNAMD